MSNKDEVEDLPDKNKKVSRVNYEAVGICAVVAFFVVHIILKKRSADRNKSNIFSQCKVDNHGIIYRLNDSAEIHYKMDNTIRYSIRF